MRRSHIRLLPKGLAKCGAPAPRAYPPDGVCLRAAPIRGRWLIERTTLGRTEAVMVTREELAQLVLEGAMVLRTEERQ